MTEIEKHAIFLCGFIIGTYDIKGGEQIPDYVQSHINAIMGEKVAHKEVIKSDIAQESIMQRVKLVKKDYNLTDDPVWPMDKVNRLIEMKEEGLGVDEIAKELDKTYSQVTSKWSHMNRKKRA